MTNRARGLFSGLLMSACLLAPAASNALEPSNDEAPWKGFSVKDITYYGMPSKSNSAFGSWESITTSSDVDHLVVSCAGSNVNWVQIEFSSPTGDLDIYVYDLQGTLLGSSGGVTNSERVNVGAFGKQTVVMKVYGYNGATGSYTPRLDCF